MQKIDYKTFEKKTDYLKLKVGQNYIRLLTDSFNGLFHEMQLPGKFISVECEGAGCNTCKNSKYPPVYKYVWIVLNRVSKEVKVLKVGKGLGEKICEKGRELGGLDNKDLEISRVGTKKEDTKYTLKVLDVNKPLTDEEIKTIEDRKTYLLNKYINL